MAKYDPLKQYKWEKDTEFKMSGAEFGLILNTFRSVLKTPEAQQILLMNEANRMIESVLGKGVEEGTVVEDLEGAPLEYPPMKVAKKD